MEVAIVTGATKGIGKAIALKLIDLQYRVVLVGRNTQLLQQLEDEIRKTGGECFMSKPIYR